MDPHDKAILWGSNESDYRTPPDCFGALDREFHFDVDAAASQASKLCVHFFGPDHGNPDYRNALTVDWSEYRMPTPYSDRRPIIFLNPPFSKTLVNAYNTGRIKIDERWVEHEKDPEKARSYDIAEWAEKCWLESQRGCTIVGIFPFAPQTDWYRKYVYGHVQGEIVDGRYPITWSGHAAREERRLPHRISFLTPEGEKIGNAGVNSAIVVWKPNYGIVGPWQPWQPYWSYREVA